MREHALTAQVSILLALFSNGCASKTAPNQAGASPPPVISQTVKRHLSLPVYPGSQPTANGIFVKGPHAHDIYAAYYRSAEPLARVESYYAAHLPKNSLKMYVNEADGGTADFVIATRGLQKQVVLVSDRGGTLIALSATGKL